MKRVDCDYYTDAIDYTQVKALREFENAAVARGVNASRRCARESADCGLQEDQVLHDGKCRRGQVVDAGAGDAHDCFLAALPGGVSGGTGAITRPTSGRTASAGLGNAFRTVASLLLMCDPRDLGVALTEDIRGLAWEPNLYLYDSYSGGVGLSAPLYRLSDRLLLQTRELMEACGCEPGVRLASVRRVKSESVGKQVALAVALRLLSGNEDASLAGADVSSASAPSVGAARHCGSVSA